MIFKEPNWQPCPLPEMIEDNEPEYELKQRLNTQMEVDLGENGVSDIKRVNMPALNLVEFLIERAKPLNLFEIRTIIYDLLLTL